MLPELTMLPVVPLRRPPSRPPLPLPHWPVGAAADEAARAARARKVQVFMMNVVVGGVEGVRQIV